ncbi:VCBS repeat-containing protein [bacterium]|nr:VCBS repeat-containing protein [bacterium]
MKNVILIFLYILTLTVLLTPTQLRTQTFTDSGISLSAAIYGSTQWGDYDNDGDLDILLTGNSGGGIAVSKIYRNDNSIFTDIAAGLVGVYEGSSAWLDYDNDGDLDVLLAGWNGVTSYCRIYRNDAGIFTDINAGFFEGSYKSSVASGDYDNDGDLDILIGWANYDLRLYRNDHGVFNLVPSTGLSISTNLGGKIAMGDYDRDGDLDVLISGTSGGIITSIFNNDNGQFSDTNVGLVGVVGSVAWGNYDSDGDLDILLSGPTGATDTSIIYRNDNGSFVNINAGLLGVGWGLSSWGDFDGDGDLDVALAGGKGSTDTLMIYRNDNGIFVNTQGLLGNSAVWGDFDSDGDLDILANSTGQITKIYVNNSSQMNTIPLAPSSLSASINGTSLNLRWNRSSDNETSQDGLTYNLRIGKSPGGVDVFSPMSDISTGFRRIVQIGNVNQDSAWTIKNLSNGTYYWSVQTVDNSFAGSVFASEKIFTINANPPTITSFTPTSGPIGTSVTITGTNFNTTAANNIVYFGAVKANVTNATSTSLSVTVPVGTTYAPITVTDTTTGLAAYSSAPFVVTFSSSQIIDVSSFASKLDFTAGTSPYTVAVGDIDGDGKADVAVVNEASNTVSIFRNTGTGGSSSFAAKVDFTTGTSPRGVAVGDVDGDGKPDVVITNNGGTTISVFRNTSTSGAITLDPKVDFTMGNGPNMVAIGDVDGDGKADLVVASEFSSGMISIFRNTGTVGTISFAAKVDSMTGSGPWGVAIGDVDGDGKPDIVNANAGNNTVSVFRNTGTIGSISLDPKIDFATGSYPLGVAIGDVDGDGKSDIVVTNYSGASVSVFRNTTTGGSITFALKADFATGNVPAGVALCDMDGDGKVDVATANYGSSTVSVLKNTSISGTISLAAKVDFTTGSSPVGVAIADIDGDGKPDLAVTNQGSGSFSVLRNNIIKSLHVSSTGSNSNDGSAQFPLADIGDAMNKASAGDTIKIGAGTWTENRTMSKQLTLRGGYAPGFLESQRNIHAYQTVWKAVTSPQVTDNQSCTFDGIVFDGSLGTAKAVNVTGGTSTITHCTIVNFFGSGNQGIAVNSGAGAVIKNNTIYNNKLAGGGVIFYSIVVNAAANAGTTRIENNIIVNNNVGLDNNLSSSIANYNCVYGNTFLNYDGTFNSPGANDINADPKFVYAAGGDFRLKGGSPCIDAGNPADPVGNEPAPNGGRINIGNFGGTSAASKTGVNPVTFVSTAGNDNNDGSINNPYRTITKALQSALGDTIKVAAGNYAEGVITTGFAVMRGGYGGDFLESSRIPAVNQTVIEAVSSTMWYDAFGVQVDGFVFDGKTNVAGTGLHLVGPASITHTVIKNVKNSPGYGIRAEANVSVINNTIYNNTHGVYLSSGASSIVKNNIIRGNGFGLNNSAAAGIGSYNDYFNNSFNYTGTFTSPGIGDLALDPLNINAAGGNFQLASNSPCINAGDPAAQYNDPDGSRNDIGAYRFQDFPPGVPSSLTLTPIINYSVSLKWRRNTDSDFLRYRVYSGTNGIVYNQIDSNVTVSDTTSLIGPLAPNGTYYFRVTALDNSLNESSPAAVNVNFSFRMNDSLTLVEFYDSTGGTGWTNKTNWKSSSTLDSWYGVTVLNDRVTQLNLSDNALMGVIPQEIGLLTNLVYLNLSKNQFTGVFPAQICGLTDLTQLYLNECFISGNIPTEIGNLTNLTTLQLYSNSLTGSIPTQIGNLSNLSILYLYNNQLSGSIPSSIGNLTNLTHLYLLNNQLSGSIPTEIGNLTNLILLALHTNQLTGTIPSQLGNLSNLQELYLLNNKLSGAVPASLTGLNQLTGLYLSSNDLTGLPDFSAAASLENLEIENNQFTFEDIEPNIGAPSQSFVYSPQDSIGTQKDTTVNLNAALSFGVTVGGANNQYQWFKNGASLGGATSSSYPIASAQATDAGQYVCRITNTVATALTLYSRPFNLTVTVIAPSITAGSIQVSNANPAPGTDVAVTVPVTGSSPTVKLFFGKPHQNPGDSVSMSFNGSAFVATIFGASVTQDGLWYRIRAQNSGGLSYYPSSTGRQAIAVQITDLASIKTLSAYPNGLQSDAYSTMALSLNGALSLTNHFGPQESDGGGPSNWRALSFDAATQTFSDVTSVSSANAYYFYHRSGANEDLFSSVTNPTAISTNVFNVWILKPGWNLVPWAHSFTATVSARDNAQIGRIWLRSGKSGWEESTQLRPYAGYMIYNKTAGDVVLGNVLSWTPSAGKSVAEYLSWSVRFKANAGDYRDDYNVIGASVLSSDGLDDMDERDPISVGEGVNVYFTSAASEKTLAYDIRSSGDEHVWNMTVENSSKNKKTFLQWEADQLPQEFSLILYDITHNKKIDALGIAAGYEFRNERPTNFKIFAGGADWVKQNVQQLESELPREFSLHQNYPNPFNPTTRIAFDVAQSGNVKIKVYNVLGQEVATVVNRYYETGRYDIEWNGRDDLGRQLSSGVYIYRLESGRVSRVKKMLLVK